MKANQDKAPAELAALACSPALEGLKARLRAAAENAEFEMSVCPTDYLRGRHAAAVEALSMALQCQESLEVSDRP